MIDMPKRKSRLRKKKPWIVLSLPEGKERKFYSLKSLQEFLFRRG